MRNQQENSEIKPALNIEIDVVSLLQKDFHVTPSALKSIYSPLAIHFAQAVEQGPF